MKHLFTFVERTFWGVAGLALILIIMFAVLHVLRTNGQSVPVVGGALSSGAGWVGAHAQNY